MVLEGIMNVIGREMLSPILSNHKLRDFQQGIVCRIYWQNSGTIKNVIEVTSYLLEGSHQVMKHIPEIGYGP